MTIDRYWIYEKNPYRLRDGEDPSEDTLFEKGMRTIKGVVSGGIEALDDANIIKFNRIIKKFSGDSQFIIITHNKLTMAAVDTIYGVHNQGGISSVLPVDFRSLKHENYWEEVSNKG